MICNLVGSTLACSATTAVAVIALAAPAAANVDVESDRAQQGSENATLTFVAEAQSRKAGITSLRVTLPKGIAAKDVTLVTAPTDWTMRPRKDGYEVKGPALEVGEKARYSVRVAKLPLGRSWLAFATTQRYDDGRADRWVELPDDQTGRDGTAGGAAAERGHPAPVLELAAAETGPVVTATDPQKRVNVSSNRSRVSALAIAASIAVLLAAGLAGWWGWRQLRRKRHRPAHYA